MLTREHRLDRKHFMRVLTSGKMYHAPHISLKAVALPRERTRFSVVTSKRVAARAAKRNLLRRRIYHALQAHGFPARGFGGIFFTKQEASRATYTELAKEVSDLLSRARIS